MKKILIIALTVMYLSTGAFAQSDLQPIAEIKLGGRTPITLKQLRARVTSVEQEFGRKTVIEERKQILEDLINERLIVQAAEKEGIKIIDSEVNNYFNQQISNQVGRYITEAELIEELKKQGNISIDDYMKNTTGMSLAEYKTSLRIYMTMQAYVMQKKPQELQSIPNPTDEEIRLQYELNKQLFVQPDTVKLFLVVSEKGTKPAAAEKTVKEIQKKLSSNAKAIEEIRTKFHQKNAAYRAAEVFITKTPVDAQRYGFSLEELVKIFAMKKGAVSPVDEMPAAFRCFMVLEKTETKFLALSDVVQPGSNVSLYEAIKNRLMLERQNQALSEALMAVINDLRKPENFAILKKDSELEKLLSW